MRRAVKGFLASLRTFLVVFARNSYNYYGRLSVAYRVVLLVDILQTINLALIANLAFERPLSSLPSLANFI